MREIVLDTETTGFEPKEGHRMVEIGCVELVNQLPTGNTYHQYINPERDMPEEAMRVHGLSNDFLEDFPVFKRVAGEFLDFIGDAALVIHNAEFDMRFINFELEKANFPVVPFDRAVDTLMIARKKFPGSPASLDALCRRFDIDNSDRTLHGALLDAELLSEVYLELLGGRQHGLVLKEDADGAESGNAAALSSRIKRQDRPARSFAPSAEEIEKHAELVAALGDGTLWRDAG